MFRIPFYFIKQYLFWLVFFAINRLVFVLWNVKELISFPITETLATFWHAIYLDTSAACYILFFPFLLLFLQSLIKTRIFPILLNVYTVLVIIVVSLITACEFGVYDEWGIKLHYKALAYLEHPEEVMHTAEIKIIVISLLLIVLQTIAGGYIYKRWFYSPFVLIKRYYIVSALFLLITPVLLILGLRGGWQPIPINQSSVYYSKHNVLNLAAVNSAWNLGHSIEQNKKYLDTNPYICYDDKEAKQTIEELYKVEKDTTVKLLVASQPNIVLIILESWTAGLIHSLGGYEGVTPQFDGLAKKGILFTEFYATGNRSDQGMAALLSAFPSQPTTSIIKQADKFQQLPCINKELAKEGYNTSFYFGGQLNYGNIKSYMYYNDFDKVMEGDDFESDLPRGRLGIPDEYVFQYHLKEMAKEKEPFFSTIFTLSSHSPYDQPMKDVIDWGEEDNPYLNSVYYTDKCLGDYFKEAKKQKWFDNTLFIIVADHSHVSPQKWHVFSKTYQHIPMLFYGNVIKEEYRGMKNDKICSQVDLPATLLSQLEISHSMFKWSKNIFNPYSSPFAYYSFVDGVGWVVPDNYFAYHYGNGKMYFMELNSKDEKTLLKEGKSYLQVVFQEYLNY